MKAGAGAGAGRVRRSPALLNNQPRCALFTHSRAAAQPRRATAGGAIVREWAGRTPGCSSGRLAAARNVSAMCVSLAPAEPMLAPARTTTITPASLCHRSAATDAARPCVASAQCSALPHNVGFALRCPGACAWDGPRPARSVLETGPRAVRIGTQTCLSPWRHSGGAGAAAIATRLHLSYDSVGAAAT